MAKYTIRKELGDDGNATWWAYDEKGDYVTGTCSKSGPDHCEERLRGVLQAKAEFVPELDRIVEIG